MLSNETIALTIPELCKQLGIKLHCPDCRESIWQFISLGGTKEVLWASHRYCDKDAIKLLSINDKIEMDECVLCGGSKIQHLNWSEVYSKDFKFKPLTYRVKSIKLIERCECGKTYEEHKATWKEQIVAEAIGKAISARELCGEAACFEFKPVQMVEIMVSK